MCVIFALLLLCWFVGTWDEVKYVRSFIHRLQLHLSFRITITITTIAIAIPAWTQWMISETFHKEFCCVVSHQKDKTRQDCVVFVIFILFVFFYCCFCFINSFFKSYTRVRYIMLLCTTSTHLNIINHKFSEKLI